MIGIPLTTVPDSHDPGKCKLLKDDRMERSTARIIKGAEATVQGRFQLQAGCPVQDQTPASQVRVTENQPDYIVLEITCSCGKKSHVKCEYANT